jgi:CHAD domain-containing protein
MADGKWVTGVTPDTPAVEAARVVLSARLATVRDRLAPAVGQADEDPEHVHQLRVATRRAGAAVRIFRELLPRRRRREAKAVLRAVRRAAGDARDWDVFLNLLDGSEALRATGFEPASDFLYGYAFGERSAAQVILSGVAASQADPLREVCEHVPGSVREADDPTAPRTAGALSVAVLGELFAEFAAEVEAGPRTATELHQLRITAKRVRYAMEVFAGCFGPPFRDALYPAVETVQTILGAVQDGSVAIDRLMAVYARVRARRPVVAARIRPGITGLTREVRGRVRSERRAFRTWVREWADLTAAHPLPTLLATAAG